MDTSGVRHGFAEGEFGAGTRSPGASSAADHVLFGNSNQERGAPETPLVVPADPAGPQTPTPAADAAAPAQPAPASPTPTELEENAVNHERDAIIARYKARRAAERVANAEAIDPAAFADAMADGAQPPAAAAPAAPEGEAPQAAAASPLVLKIRGRDVPATREQLINVIRENADPSFTGEDISDKALVNTAQVIAIAHLKHQEAEEARARAAYQPQPAAAPAPQAPAPAPAQPAPQAKSLEELRLHMVERLQYGDPQEAQKAVADYDAAKAAFEDAQRAARQAQTQFQQELNAWGARNIDVAAEATPQAAYFEKTALREAANDLRRLGYDDRLVSSALNNPERMTDLVNDARQRGLPVRNPIDMLEAAAAQTRAVFGMPSPSQAQPAAAAFQNPALQPPPTAANQRIEAKRTLQAQPVRSGNPQAPQVPQLSEIDKRRMVIARMQQQRTAPNA